MTEEKKLNYFEELNNINVKDKIEKKGDLSYLSWAWAWQEIKKRHSSIQYEVVKNESGLPFFKSEEGYIVYTKVTIDDITHEMWLPVMDGTNKAMKDKRYTYKVQKKKWSTQYNKYVRTKDSEGNYLFEEREVEAATMFDINTTIMRCLVKNIAMHGLGLYIYAGEDIPSAEKDDILEEKKKETKEKQITKKLSKVFDDDMKQVMQDVNKNTAEEIKNAIGACESKDAVDEKYLEYKTDMTKLYKYDISLFNEVKEFKENIKSLLQ